MVKKSKDEPISQNNRMNLPKPEWLTTLEKKLNKTTKEKYSSLLEGSPESLFLGADKWPKFFALKSLYPIYPFDFRLTDNILLARPEDMYGSVVIKSTKEGLKDIHKQVPIYLSRRTWLHVPSMDLWIDSTKDLDGKHYTLNADFRLAVFLSYCVPEMQEVVINPDPVAYSEFKERAYYNNSKHHEFKTLEELWAKSAIPVDHASLGPYHGDTSPDCKISKVWISHYGATKIIPNDINWGSMGENDVDVKYDPKKTAMENIASMLTVFQINGHSGTYKESCSEIKEKFFNYSFEQL